MVENKSTIFPDVHSVVITNALGLDIGKLMVHVILGQI